MPTAWCIPCSQHAPPRVWEYEQPYIGNLILNARTFDRRVAHWYFEDWEALARDNTRIWETYYRAYPLNDHLADWETRLEEYCALVGGGSAGDLRGAHGLCDRVNMR